MPGNRHQNSKRFEKISDVAVLLNSGGQGYISFLYVTNASKHCKMKSRFKAKDGHDKTKTHIQQWTLKDSAVTLWAGSCRKSLTSGERSLMVWLVEPLAC